MIITTMSHLSPRRQDSSLSLWPADRPSAELHDLPPYIQFPIQQSGFPLEDRARDQQAKTASVSHHNLTRTSCLLVGFESCTYARVRRLSLYGSSSDACSPRTFTSDVIVSGGWALPVLVTRADRRGGKFVAVESLVGGGGAAAAVFAATMNSWILSQRRGTAELGFVGLLRVDD
ncbi:hypothetical protein BO86DRAFT_239595 [Aspergillus japonicus CBS 114.51]|uniref:Uncharacterized protein n=1 Tax=Aspergillus japonicus CBS 114.51 TaxID=1448312 RepID=A0A8T8X846_ASPJA|nr:hypothetical protein BO86DRAFT_239595 [Aspergillus japonicus CBS 114.51]RAH84296.1 hypothetical protein BO86DRAFT_239595 [Aspergillus japonicus CBS 114.51]